MAKKKTTRRSTQKRDTVKTPNATLYAKRSARGRFKEMDEKGRSLKDEVYGDRGDRRAA